MIYIPSPSFDYHTRHFWTILDNSEQLLGGSKRNPHLLSYFRRNFSLWSRFSLVWAIRRIDPNLPRSTKVYVLNPWSLNTLAKNALLVAPERRRDFSPPLSTPRKRRKRRRHRVERRLRAAPLDPDVAPSPKRARRAGISPCLDANPADFTLNQIERLFHASFSHAFFTIWCLFLHHFYKFYSFLLTFHWPLLLQSCSIRFMLRGVLCFSVDFLKWSFETWDNTSFVEFLISTYCLLLLIVGRLVPRYLFVTRYQRLRMPLWWKKTA